MDLIGQFILCKTRDAIPEGWVVRQHDEWYLGSHPTLPVTNILATDSSRIGWLLGWAISPDGVMVKQTCSFNVRPDDANISEQFESALYDHGGRWAAVFLAPALHRLYLDACGSLAAVFSPRHEILASTPTLVPYSKGCDDDHELAEKVIISGQDCGYPFGLTPRRHLERLLPNHFLDLETWESVRHWPTGDFVEIHNTESAVSEFAALLKKQIATVARLGSYYLPLSGGRDSRVLLACSREALRSCNLFIVEMPTHAAKLDCQIVKKMSRRFGLGHRVLSFERATQDELDVFSYRTGRCVDGLTLNYARVFQQLDRKLPMFWGAAGELGRSYHWRRGDAKSSKISAEDLLQRLTRLLPGVSGSRIRTRAQKWLETLPLRNALSVWGLLYNELYNGCWVGPKEYGYTHNAFRLWPFNHRRLIEIMLSLPADYRQDLRFERDIIEKQWPELLQFPFNWPMGWRKLLLFMRRHTKLVLKRLFPESRNMSKHG
jgi:hypothetical protein